DARMTLTRSLHDALPIYRESPLRRQAWELTWAIITPREEYCQVPRDNDKRRVPPPTQGGGNRCRTPQYRQRARLRRTRVRFLDSARLYSKGCHPRACHANPVSP